MNRPSPPLPSVFVLAAGYSTRLGRPKALARLHGRTLLQRLATTLAPVFGSRVCIVVPPRSALRRAARAVGWRCIENPQRAQGMSSSVSVAIARCGNAPAAMFLPVDLAGLRTRDVERLLRRWRANRRCIVGRDQQGRAVIPLILPRRLFGLRRHLQGDAGLKDLIAMQPAADIRQVRMRSAKLDIDTPADLAAARRRFSLSSARAGSPRRLR